MMQNEQLHYRRSPSSRSLLLALLDGFERATLSCRFSSTRVGDVFPCPFRLGCGCACPLTFAFGFTAERRVSLN